MKSKDANVQSPRSSRREEAQNNWRWIRLGDHIAKIGSGFTPLGGHKVYQTSGVPLIRSQNVHMNRFEPEGLAFISDEQSVEMDSSQVLAGDVLLNITGASIGRVCVAPAEHCPANVNQHVCIIRSDGSLDSEFLAFYFASHEFQKFIMSSQAGATRQALTKAMIENFCVPFTELNQQRRMAKQLREQMAEVERARAAVQAQLDAAKSLPAALLRATFTSPAAQRWPRRKLGEVTNVVNGYGFSESLQGRTDLPFPFVKVSDMNAEGAEEIVSHAANTVDNSILKELGAKTYPVGTVIFPKVGGALLTNKKRVLGVEATFDNNVMGIVPQEAESGWIFRWMLTIDLKTLANTQALPSIRQSVIAALEIPMPPKAERQQLCARLNAELTATRALVESLESRLAEIELLPTALLRETFNGQS